MPRVLYLWVAIGFASGAAAALPGASVEAPQPPSILIEHARARPTPPGAHVAAVYLRIVNAGGADRLLRLSTPVAQQAQIHETRREQGMVSMRQLPFLEIPAHSSVEIAPGAVHIMLQGLKAPLRNGDHFTMTLVFGSAGTLATEVTVRVDP